jgi:hypothetical protein
MTSKIAFDNINLPSSLLEMASEFTTARTETFNYIVAGCRGLALIKGERARHICFSLHFVCSGGWAGVGVCVCVCRLLR